MTRDREFIDFLYKVVLQRPGEEVEVGDWINFVSNHSLLETYQLFVDSEEGQAKSGGALAFPLRHYYSPITATDAWQAIHDPAATPPSALLDIDLALDQQAKFWRDNRQHIAAVSFPEHQEERHRYHYMNDVYSYGDAIMLSTMLRASRPKQIIEIGCGFSSACMLDTIDAAKLNVSKILFIDPEPERLIGLLWEQDQRRIEIYPNGVQQTDPKEFETLDANDVLFIDSSHVMKTGSDVNFDLFEVLPRLKPGVLIHFHDIFYPFEYPANWVRAGYSWNELYALRAFLMNNKSYEIVFFNHAMSTFHPELLREKPEFLTNPGGAIWLRKK